MQVNRADSVTYAINAQGGVYLLGRMSPVWEIILIEFCCAYGLECVVGSLVSYKLTYKLFELGKIHSVIFETTIICATVGLMCPAMGFLAVWFYYLHYAGFNIFTLLVNYDKMSCNSVFKKINLNCGYCFYVIS